MEKEVFQIVPAAETDSAEVLALYKSQLGRKYCFWDEDYPNADTVAFDRSRDSLFVLKEKGRILAALSVDRDPEADALPCWTKELQPSGELARLAVLPTEQNRGLAKHIIRFGLEELKRRGFRSMHFLVVPENASAMACYAHFGFTRVGECDLYGRHFWCYEIAL